MRCEFKIVKKGSIGLKKFFKFFFNETRILNDGFKGGGVEYFMARDDYTMNVIRHAYVLTSEDNSEANFNQSPYHSFCGDIVEKHVKLKHLSGIPWSPLFHRQSSAGRFDKIVSGLHF